MFPIRVKTVQESDLRMLGSLARNIQRVLPVTQADIDAAAALGKGWVVWKVFEVSDPLDNLRGGTQLIIRQNSIQPGQNVRRVIFVSGPGGQTVVIRGTDYIVLPDAIANSLSYVKAFGGTEQRNIPQPYTQVNYVTNTAQTAVDTGIMIDFAKNYEFEIEARATTGSWYILQSRASASGNITGIHGATSGNTITLVVGNVTVCTSAITRTVGNKLYVKATLNAGTATLYVKDETANTEDTQTGSYGTSQPNPTAAVYLLGNAGGQYVDVNSDIYMARIKENDTVVMDYVPARQVATAGFYDTVSGTFKTAETPANLSADGNTVPAPDYPMDIVSNNGVLKARHQSGLPLGYDALEYLQSDGNQMIDLGLKWTYTIGTEVECEQLAYSSLAIGPIGTKGSSGIWGDFVASNYTHYACFGNKTDKQYTMSMVDGQFHTWTINNAAASIDGVVKTTDIAGSNSSLVSTDNIGLFGRYDGSGNIERCGRWRVKYAKIYNSGLLIHHFVPARRKSDTVLGMFDLVSGQFFTNQGTGTFTAGTAVSDPVEIYTDGTVETINVHSKNLCNLETPYVFTSSSPNYTDSLTPTWCKFKENTRYTITYRFTPEEVTYSAAGNLIFTVVTYTDGTVDYNGGIKDNNLSSGITTYTTTAGKTIASIVGLYKHNRFTGGTITINSMQIEEGTTSTDYEPYFNGGTATAEMLLKVGDYQDVQSIIDGAITKNVGVKVFDGTENFSVINHTFRYSLTGLLMNTKMICSHFDGDVSPSVITSNQPDLTVKNNASNNNNAYFKYTAKTTVEDFQQWLADQYAAGTPVIVIYPLATPTMESVAGQTLQVTDGDNTLEITQASLTGLELEAEYSAAVQLTIQEVQDANLDNNVTVTIQ